MRQSSRKRQRFCCAVCAVVMVLLLSATGAGAQPSEAVRLYEAGIRLKRAGKPTEAAAKLQAAVRAYPRYMQAHYALGWVYRQLGMDGKAVEAFREVIRLAPQSAEAVEAARAIERIRLGPPVASAGPDTIAFTCTREGNTDIYIMELGAGSVQRVTTHPAVDDSPSWAPDRTRLAFVSERDGNREIYITALDGTGVWRLTDDPGVDDHPVWSPDGTQIAFESNRSGTMAVYLASVVDGQIRRLSSWPGGEWMGDWSPTGSHLAVLRSCEGVRPPGTKVYIVGANGMDARRLTPNPEPEGRPVWAPDGEHLYFTWQFDRSAQVCRASVDGLSLANVSRSPYNDRLCDVSPDGQRLLILSDRQRADELWLLEIASGTARRLAAGSGADRDGSFAPARR